MKRAVSHKTKPRGAERSRSTAEPEKHAGEEAAAMLAEQRLRLVLNSVITETREMEERMRAIYENSADGFVIFDDQARPIDCTR